MGRNRRIARDQKYTQLTEPSKQRGAGGKVFRIYPEPKPDKHGAQPPEKPERDDRWH